MRQQLRGKRFRQLDSLCVIQTTIRIKGVESTWRSGSQQQLGFDLGFIGVRDPHLLFSYLSRRKVAMDLFASFQSIQNQYLNGKHNVTYPRQHR